MPNSEPTKKPMYFKRKIVAWEYRSNNNSWGYDARLSCGHKRTDLGYSNATEALCWNCTTEDYLKIN